MSDDKKAAWFLNRWARPADAEQDLLMNNTRMSAGAQLSPWHPVGPLNIAGRSTCLAVDPQRPERVYLGTAAGGLWYSNNSGATWTPQSDHLRSLSIGAVALDPQNPEICYLGTGEANLTQDSYPGWGVFRRESLTGEWIQIGAPDGNPPLPYRIGVIAVNPFDSGHLLVGSATLVDDEVAGLHHGRRNEDGTFSWTAVSGFAFQNGTHEDDSAGMSGPFRCHTVVFHPERQGTVFATAHLRNWRSGIYRSDDAGHSWRQLEMGLPSGDKFGRTSLAIGQVGDRWVLWAYAAHTRGGGILGVFRSDDDGESWRSTGGHHFANEKSGEYSNCIAVPRDRADWVVCGGRDLHRSKDGGVTWQQITEHDAPAGDPHYAPGEHHALAVVDGLELDGTLTIYDANDRGFGVGKHFGQRWGSCIADLATSMVHKLDVAGRDANVIAAGLHRNGVISRQRSDPHGWFRRDLREEGGWILFDPDDATHIITSSPGGEVRRHTRAGGWRRITPPSLEEDEKVWLPVVAMDGDRDRAAPRPLLLGTKRIWKSNDDGETWRAVSVELDGSPVSALHVSHDRSRRVYAGTERGAVFCSADGGNSWSENWAGIDLPYRYITRIDTRPSDAHHVLLTIGPTPPPGEGVPYAHIYLSIDGGRTWNSADPDGELPMVSHNCVVISDAATAFVATDYGIYRGDWMESAQRYSWTDISGELPRAFVTDLVYHPESQTLTAATYGRGIFRYRIGSEVSPSEFMRKLDQDEFEASNL